MSVESASYINQLDSTRPTSSDLKSEGDNHLRLLKSTIQTTFPNITGAVTPTQTELNRIVGVTSAIQTQLDAKAPLASPVLTGTPTVPTAATVTTNTQAASTAFVHNVLDSLGDATLAAATAQADIATTQAGIATTQAALATTNGAAQVSLATAQAVIATTKAGEAATSAANVVLTEQLNLGSKTSNPTLDNQGNALLAGALYYNSVADETRIWNGSSWVQPGYRFDGVQRKYVYTATAAQTTFAATYDVGFVDVYLNGIKLIAGTDYTATSGTNIVLATGAALNDTVDIVAYATFALASPALTGNVTVTTNSTSPALTITQDGTGNALEVRDVTSDSTPFVVDQLGNVSVGGTAQFNSRISVGASSFSDTSVRLSGTVGTAATLNGIYQDITFPATTTSAAYGYTTVLATAAAYTLPSLTHIRAYQGTFAGTVTNQIGFEASNSLIGATNDYGFYGNIPAGTGRWNFYAAGSAANYFGGNVTVGGGGTLGYGTGSGGTVTQASTAAASLVNGTVYTITSVGTTDFVALGAASNTVGVTFTKSGGAGSGTGTAASAANKAGTVTLNKPSGQITMCNGPLAASTPVAFLVNNTCVNALDSVALSFGAGPGGQEVNYTLQCVVVANGIYISLRNDTVASRSEAVVVNFNVIKGSAS